MLNEWGDPVLLSTFEEGESVCFIYKQTSRLTYTILSVNKLAERVYKIVFSCKDGKWNKSEPIYGKIVPAVAEYYKFDDEV